MHTFIYLNLLSELFFGTKLRRCSVLDAPNDVSITNETCLYDFNIQIKGIFQAYLNHFRVVSGSLYKPI